MTERARVLFRPHPRAEAADAAAAADALRAAPAPLLDFDLAALARLPSAEDALVAADAVVSGFSTVNTHALLRGVTGVVYAATPTLAEQYRRTKKLEVPPEVTRGAAWRVGAPGELAEVLRALAAGEASAEVRRVAAAQGRLREQHRGGAAERAWRAVLGAVAQRRSTSEVRPLPVRNKRARAPPACAASLRPACGVSCVRGFGISCTPDRLQSSPAAGSGGVLGALAAASATEDARRTSIHEQQIIEKSWRHGT